jgi:putative Holliday junction resolvase
MKRHLGVDLWDKRVGLAIETEWFVFAHSIVDRYKLVKELKKIISEKGITDIVVWLPYDLHGQKLERLNKTKDYILKLEGLFPEINFHWFDERFTSFSADLILDELNIKGDRRGLKDDISAREILDWYLRKNKN